MSKPVLNKNASKFTPNMASQLSLLDVEPIRKNLDVNETKSTFEVPESVLLYQDNSKEEFDKNYN